MKFNDFIRSLNEELPPEGISKILSALWYAKKGNWDTSHLIAQEIHNNLGSWVHAVLHRQEGDLSNAHYWYGKANKDQSNDSIDDELDEIIQFILEEMEEGT